MLDNWSWWQLWSLIGDQIGWMMDANQIELIDLYRIENIYNMLRNVGWKDTYAFESIFSPEDFDKWVNKLLDENPGY